MIKRAYTNNKTVHSWLGLKSLKRFDVVKVKHFYYTFMRDHFGSQG